MGEQRNPGDEELQNDADRGQNSISGYGDLDREPHPLRVDSGGDGTPEGAGGGAAEEPESGRGRDPELGNVPEGGRVGESAGR